MTTRLSRREALSAGAGLAAIALAGCVGDSEESDGKSDNESDQAGKPGYPTDRVETTVQSIPTPEIERNLVHVEPGGTVVWVGRGQRNGLAAYHPDNHKPQRIPDGAEPWTSGVLRDGSEFEMTFETEGIHDYYDTTTLCGTHEAFGVVGRVIVGEPDLDGQPAMDHDNEELPSLATNAMDDLDERTRKLLG